MRERLRLRRAAIVLAAVAGVLILAAPAATGAPATDQPATSRSIAFGADTPHAPGQTASGEASLTKLESEIGRKVAFTRDYLLWDSAFPTAYENWLGARGTVAMVSVKSKLTNGTVIPWASVAAAQPGSALYQQIASWADRLKAYGYPVYFTYNHEPEAAANAGYGTPANYIAAWRHIHDIFVARGAGNVRFMWIMTDWAFRVPSSDARYAWKWYPGDAYVDGIAADAYNWAKCRSSTGTWQSLATAISGFMTFGAQHPSIPMWLTEFGSAENPADPSAKGKWLAQAETTLTQAAYSQIVGVAYFSEPQASFPNCDWPIESSTQARTAFAAMGADSAYQGSASFTASTTGQTPPRFVGASATTGNATTETVAVPAAAGAGTGLILIATSATPRLPSAPAGWNLVASETSATMASGVWERVAAAGDGGRTVSVGFGGATKGAAQVLAYSGTAAGGPVRVARGTVRDASTSTLTTAAVPEPVTDGVAVSYWAVRTSTDTTVRPASTVTVRSSAVGSGGGRVISSAADGAQGAGVAASVSPAAGHAVSWELALAPAG